MVAFAGIEGELAVDAGVVVRAAQQTRPAAGFDAGGRAGDSSLTGLESAHEDDKGDQGTGARFEETGRLPRGGKGNGERNESQSSGEEQGQSDREDGDITRCQQSNIDQSEERQPPGARRG